MLFSTDSPPSQSKTHNFSLLTKTLFIYYVSSYFSWVWQGQIRARVSFPNNTNDCECMQNLSSELGCVCVCVCLHSHQHVAHSEWLVSPKLKFLHQLLPHHRLKFNFLASLRLNSDISDLAQCLRVCLSVCAFLIGGRRGCVLWIKLSDFQISACALKFISKGKSYQSDAWLMFLFLFSSMVQANTCAIH